MLRIKIFFLFDAIKVNSKFCPFQMERGAIISTRVTTPSGNYVKSKFLCSAWSHNK
jgi:hypothetical protein